MFKKIHLFAYVKIYPHTIKCQKNSYQKHLKKEKYEQVSLNTKLQCFHLYQMQINFLWSEDNILTGKHSVHLIQNQSYKMKSDKN